MGALGENVIFGLFRGSRSNPIKAPNIEFLILKRTIVYGIIWNNQFAEIGPNNWLWVADQKKKLEVMSESHRFLIKIWGHLVTALL